MEQQCLGCQAIKPDSTVDIYLITRVVLMDGKPTSSRDLRVTGPQLAGRVCRYRSLENRDYCLNQESEPDCRYSYRPPLGTPDIEYFKKMAADILGNKKAG